MTPVLDILIPTLAILLVILASHVCLRRAIGNLLRDVADLRRRLRGLESAFDRITTALVRARDSGALDPNDGREA